MKRSTRITITALSLVFAVAQPSFASVVDCDAPRFDTGSVLYLYYPTTDDPHFPGFTTGASPLADFDVTELDGTLSEITLIDRISQLVRQDVCEFDIEVVQTRTDVGTTNPDPTDTRWQVLGIGTDSKGGLFGTAELVDIGDTVLKDHARVWAGSFETIYGGTGLALNGTDSTLERWANAIAGTTSHEAGHNYGLGHGDSAPVAGEDIQNNHLLATGSTGLSGEQRTQNRHFSNVSHEILAANLGLLERTLQNWDLVNPNAASADGLTVTVLVLPADGIPSKTRMFTFTGSAGVPGSPWTDVTITADGTESFQGTTYNRFKIAFIAGQAWTNSNGAQPSGVVPGGETIHLGVGLTTNAVIRETEYTSGGIPLPLKARVPGFDATSTFLVDGTFQISIFNFDPGNPLILSAANVARLPRTLSLAQMVAGGSLIDDNGLAIQPWQQDVINAVPTVLTDRAELPIGLLSEGRIVEDVVPFDPGCTPSDSSASDSIALAPNEPVYCPEGTQVSLFPSARVYIEMTVTDPDAFFFDVNTQQFIVGPLTTQMYVQVAGQKPDCNQNGVDDTIEILDGLLLDSNNNGFADVCEVIQVPALFERNVVLLTLLIGLAAIFALRAQIQSQSRGDRGVA